MAQYFRVVGCPNRYVEILPPPEYVTLSDGETWVETRTPYRTSCYGQIEQVGAMSIELLIPLNLANKKDAAIIRQIEAARLSAEEISRMWY